VSVPAIGAADLDRARAGDADTWETLYRRVYPRLFAYARRRLATEEQAEEAVSETMVRAMDRIGSYRAGRAGLDGWLFGIARLVVLETYRSRARATAADPQRIADLSRDTAPDPESLVLAGEERRVLVAAFARLSQDDQDLLEQRVVAGLDAAQVAALSNRRPGAVRTAQSRALARLRIEFEGLMA
jgi:RNA polymerase sigma-70 factor, ECF subfamily